MGSPVAHRPEGDPFAYGEELAAAAYRCVSSSFDLKVCRDGVILLQVNGLDPIPSAADVGVPRLVEWWGRCMDYANCANLLFYAAVLEEMNLGLSEFEEITRRGVFVLTRDNGEETGGSIPSNSFAGVRYMDRHPSVQGMTGWVRQMHRTTVSVAVCERLGTTLELACQSATLVRDLATIGRALAQYKIGNYRTALVLTWFVVESTLANKWAAYLDESQLTQSDGERRISRERRKNLEGRDYPISVIANMLELAGRLETRVYRIVDRVRGYRNKVVHQDADFVCSDTHCREAFELATALATEGSGLSVRLDYSYSVMG